VNLHTFHYAGNNPLKYTDPDGKDVHNKTEHVVAVRAENGDYLLLGPNAIYFGKVDGVLTPNSAQIRLPIAYFFV
jgi:hypothetical protein